MEWLTLLAIIAGPIVAIQVQKMIERVTKEKKEKKDIFLTLMRTRNTLSREHVEALNMIPLLFWKKNPQETEIRTKWVPS
jgi:malic enzyme